MIDLPRRLNVSQMTPAELAINSALVAVAEQGDDPRLEMATTALLQARTNVADFVDGVE